MVVVHAVFFSTVFVGCKKVEDVITMVFVLGKETVR